MKIGINLRREIPLAFALGLLVLIVIGVVAYRSIHESLRSAAIVAQSQHTMMLIEATEGDVVTAESEGRGFILTGDEQYLTVYRKNVRDTAEDLRQLRASVLEPKVNAKLNEFEKLITARLERLQATVEYRMTHSLEESLAMFHGVGKKLMDDLRDITDATEAIENRLIVEREQQAQALARRTTLVIVLGSLLGILIAAFSTVIILTDIGHRERLEREVLEISEREQRRIGQDLHDGVCQHLTGISLLCRSLQQKLADRAIAETGEAARITSLINDGIEQTRRVTHGLYPVPNEPKGLMQALQALAASVHGADQLACRFECPAPVLVTDQMVATHLYRIAQEAVQNAIRHARPTAITLHLAAEQDRIVLSITDDGCGLAEDRLHKKGLGLDIMSYRAHTIGARLEIRRGVERGTVVYCVLPGYAVG